MSFSRLLGVEINDCYICLGYRSGRRLHGVMRFDMPLADGVISNEPMLKEVVRDYCATHKCGKRIMIALNTKKAVTRFTRVVAPKKRSLFFDNSKPDMADALPEYIFSDYVADYRRLDSTTALVCGLPKEESLVIAGLFKDMGLMPLRLDIYANCVSLALEREGGDAVCAARGCIIYISNGILREIITPAGVHELGTVLDVVGETGIKAYNPGGYDWADEAFRRAGIEVRRGYELGLMGLFSIN